jgi:hypothetical protein
VGYKASLNQRQIRQYPASVFTTLQVGLGWRSWQKAATNQKVASSNLSVRTINRLRGFSSNFKPLVWRDRGNAESTVGEGEAREGRSLAAAAFYDLYDQPLRTRYPIPPITTSITTTTSMTCQLSIRKSYP